jgi:hypothetical protein
MSATENDKNFAAEPARQDEPFFPTPPSDPPPCSTAQHSNEAPIPELTIPPYDPSNPMSSPSLTTHTDSDICEATQVEENAPQLPPQLPPPGQQSQKELQGTRKSGWGRRLSGWGSKAATPFNALANKMGSETFLPTSMAKECDKAARILKSFCSRCPTPFSFIFKKART